MKITPGPLLCFTTDGHDLMLQEAIDHYQPQIDECIKEINRLTTALSEEKRRRELAESRLAAWEMWAMDDEDTPMPEFTNGAL